jgi:hypothetical protein
MFPKTAEERALVRFWLGTLSQVYFERVTMESSPQIQEILTLLFPKDKPFRLRCNTEMKISKI